MKRVVFVLPLLLMGILLVWVYTRDESGGRAPARKGPFRVPGEATRALPHGDWKEPGPERFEPAVLRGRVYDANGRPVRRAEVARIWPKPYDLVFTGPEGSYEMAFPRPGDYLVEGSLTIDLAPRRVVVEIPAEGDPPQLDFHLQPAGFVFGEILVEQAPLWDGIVDLYVRDLFGDLERVADTDCDNGFFNFFWEPPRDLPLQLVVQTTDGYMEKPFEFVFTGKPVKVPRIRLTRFPTLKLRMRLPDGSYAEQVVAARADELGPEIRNGRGNVVRDGWPRQLAGWNSKIIVAEKSNVTRRFALRGDKYVVVRDVELVLDQLREFEAVVRPGPLAVQRRLIDEHGRPVHARFALGARPPVETGPDGYFSIDLPHGGVFTLHLTALHGGAHGWVPLPPAPDRNWTAFLVDADDAAAPCTLPLGGRVLLLARRKASIALASGWTVEVEERPDSYGVLSPPFRPGPDRWTRGAWRPVTRGGVTVWHWDHPPSETGEPIDLLPDDFTILDAR